MAMILGLFSGTWNKIMSFFSDHRMLSWKSSFFVTPFFEFFPRSSSVYFGVSPSLQSEILAPSLNCAENREEGKKAGQENERLKKFFSLAWASSNVNQIEKKLNSK